MKKIPFLLLLTLGCAPEVAPDAFETAEFELTREQRQCRRQARRGLRMAWECGGKERRLRGALKEACPDHRWLAYRVDPLVQCEDVVARRGTWQVSRPFVRAREPNLQRVCGYTWVPNNANRPRPQLGALPNTPGLRLERDCEVVAPHALPEAVTDELRASFEAQVEAPLWSENTPAAPVRVAVIDGGFGGVAFGDQVPADGVHHAMAVSSVVRSLGCPNQGEDGFCVAGAPTYPAMPLIARGRSGELGGWFGAQGDYAAAVVAAVDDWRTGEFRVRPKLILNLSLGWVGDYDVTTTGRLSGQIALWATQYAACQGALLIAAAGNRGHDAGTGPLFPAGWEQLPAVCGEGDDYRPMVHAVGGVDGRDEPLAISRPGAQPRLTAPAAMVTVRRDTAAYQGQDVPTEVLSGTSMAAAAASGVASMVWSLRPELSAAEVMELLWGSGEPLEEGADFGYLGELRERHRLSAWRAFDAACPEGTEIGNCPAQRPSAPALRGAYEDGAPDLGQFQDLLYPDPETVQLDPGAPEPNDPQSNYEGPWAVPQPGTPNCPLCGIFGNTLYGKLDSGLAGKALGTATLYVYTHWTQTKIKLGSLPFNSNFATSLSNQMPQNPTSAWLVIPVTAKGKTTYTSSELFIF